MRKRLMTVLVMMLLMLTMNVTQAFAGVSLPSISSSKYISTYTYSSTGKVYAYKEAALQNKTGGYIACATDECRIMKVSGDAVQVSYPVSGGRKTAWFAREAFTYRDLAKNGAQKSFVASGKVTTYKWKGKTSTFGYIAKNDKCYLLRGDSDSNWLQVIYPVSTGYKMAWVKCADIKNMIWPSSNVAVSSISVSPSTATITGLGATKQLSAAISPSNATNKSVTWSSSNTSIATVNSTGKVSAKSPGICTITAKSANGKTAKCSITVKANVYMLFINGFSTYAAGTNNISNLESRLYNNQVWNIKDNYHLTYNCEGNGANSNGIKNAISTAYANATSQDIGVFYMYAHGAEGEIALKFSDSDSWLPAVTIKYNTLVKELAGTKCKRIIVILDSCHSGSFVSEIQNLAVDQQQRFIVITSSGQFTSSYSDRESLPEKNQGSAFAKTIYNGLGKASGYYNADLNKNGEVTAKELGLYVNQTISAMTFANGQKTVPYYYMLDPNMVVYK